MAPQQRLCTALTLLALVSAPRNTVGQRAGACDKAPCLNGGTCHESVPADGGGHRHLQDTCAGASVAARTEEIDAQCCGTDDSACAEGIPTSCDSGCAAAFLPFWKDCGATFASADDLRPVVKLCQARARGYTCACAAGWSGDDCTVDSRPGFTQVETHIVGADAAALAFIEGALPPGSQGQTWALCFDSRTDCSDCPLARYSSSTGACSCDEGQRTFHGSCDAHAETVVLGHNAYGYTFGGYAMRPWAGGGAHEAATGDFLFRVGPMPAAVYQPQAGSHNDADYQFRRYDCWPEWGYHDGSDLNFGYCGGALGHLASCNQGHTYEGRPNEVCGSRYGWGATDMEVWYRIRN